MQLIERFRQRLRLEMPGVTFSAGVAAHARRSPTETVAYLEPRRRPGA